MKRLTEEEISILIEAINSVRESIRGRAEEMGASEEEIENAYGALKYYLSNVSSLNSPFGFSAPLLWWPEDEY